MARCPLCSTRSAKRFCPAKETSICAVCCGEKREVEIDCPSGCPHLQAAREYESAKIPMSQRVDPQEMARYDEFFLNRFAALIHVLSQAAVTEREQSPGFVDADAVAAYRALQTTMKTLESGIYYETLPEGAARMALFRRLKGVLDEVMKPQQEAGFRALRPAEAVDVLGFLIMSAAFQTGARPRSRRYLDWLASHAVPQQPKEEASRIVLP
jgi:hypothetical protein